MKKQTKRIFAAIICISLCSAMVSCGDSNDDEESKAPKVSLTGSSDTVQTADTSEAAADEQGEDSSTTTTTAAPEESQAEPAEIKYTKEQFPSDFESPAHVKGKLTFMGVDLSYGKTVQELLDAGFKANYNLNTEIESQKQSLGSIIQMKYGDDSVDRYITIDVANLTDKTIKVNEATVYGVIIRPYEDGMEEGKKESEYTLPGGVTFGMDMKEVYDKLGICRDVVVYPDSGGGHFQYIDDDNGYPLGLVEYEFRDFKLYRVSLS